MGMATQGVTGIKGLFEKRGWFYFKPQRSKVWPKGTPQPQPKAIALRTRDLVAAVTRMAELRIEVHEKCAQKADTMEVILPLYFAAKGDDTKATRLARKVVLEGFARMCGNPRVDAITERMIDDWRAELAVKGGGSGRPAKPATLRSYTITLRAFLKWCLERKMIRVHPLPRMTRALRVTTTRVEGFLTEEEREKLLAEPAPPYIRLILMLGFFQGLRDGEMLALNRKWVWLAEDGGRGTLTVQETPIEFRDGTLGVWRPKCNKRRTLRLHSRVLALLAEQGMSEPYLLAPENRTWPDETMNAKRFEAKKALAGVAKRAGVRRLTFHMMRHSFATHLAMKGVSLAEIAGLLGDSLAVTEKHYAGFCPSKVNPVEVL